MSVVDPPPPILLDPLPYHREIVAYLKTAEPELWRWASSAQGRDEFADQMRTGAAEGKTIDWMPKGIRNWRSVCALVAQRLGVTVPVTLYQASGGFGANAMICHLPNEAHIIFTGPILATLKGVELDAMLAHELAHYRLWEMEGGDFLVADRLLTAAVSDHRAAASHAQTARRFSALQRKSLPIAEHSWGAVSWRQRSRRW